MAVVNFLFHHGIISLSLCSFPNSCCSSVHVVSVNSGLNDDDNLKLTNVINIIGVVIIIMTLIVVLTHVVLLSQSSLRRKVIKGPLTRRIVNVIKNGRV